MPSTERNASSIPAWDAWRKWLTLDSPPPFVIIGPSGAGKTALLEWLALQEIESLLNPPDGKQLRGDLRVPIFVSLSDSADVPLRDLVLKAASSLPKGVFGALRERNQLVALIDGFDEVPWARERLLREIGELAMHCAVASRPAHGAEELVASPFHCWGIEDFSAADSVNLANSYPGLADSAEPMEVVRPPLGQLMSRPLYLLAWCAARNLPDDSRPNSLTGICRRMLELTLVRHGAFGDQRRTDPYGAGEYAAIVERFMLWIGKLGMYFAEREFRGCRLDDKEGKSILADAQKNRFAHEALRMGLLHKFAETFYLPKVPLVEFCIGNYFLSDAQNRPDAPLLMLECFRKWIWRPSLHDTLDHLFSGLWNDSNENVRSWATTLVEWAIATGSCDLSGKEAAPPSTQDDLLYPFAMSAVRWIALHPSLMRPSDESAPLISTAERVAASIGPAISLIVHSSADRVDERRYDGLKGSVLLPAMITHAIRVSFAGNARQQFMWHPHIRSLARRLLPSSAASFIASCWNGFQSNEDITSRCAWTAAACGAAETIDPGDAEGLIELWMGRHRAASREDEREFWTDVIEQAARRLPESEAADLARRWKSQDGGGSGKWGAINGAMRRVAESEAVAIVEALAGGDRATAPTFAILQASLRVPISQAGQLVTKWSEKVGGPDPQISDPWWSAVEGASTRVAPNDVMSVVVGLLKKHQACIQATGSARWLRAIEGVSSRVSATDAPELVDILATASDDQELEGHSKRYPHLMWAASCIEPRRAAALCLKWVQLAEYRNDARWLWAARGAALRLTSGDTPTIVHAAVQGFLKAEADGLKELWLGVIEAATTSARAKDAVRVCDFLCENDLSWAAITNVDFAEVALIFSPDSDAEQSTHSWKTFLREPTVDRKSEHLLLDRELAAAPPLVRRALAGTIPLAFRHRQLLEALAKRLRDSVAQRDDSVAWVSWSDWCDEAQLTRQHIKPPDRELLVADLLARGMIERKAAGPKVKRYRITSAGAEELHQLEETPAGSARR